jgi:hypothetical protein
MTLRTFGRIRSMLRAFTDFTVILANPIRIGLESVLGSRAGGGDVLGGIGGLFGFGGSGAGDPINGIIGTGFSQGWIARWSRGWIAGYWYGSAPAL